MAERPPKARGTISNPNVIKVTAPQGKVLLATHGDTMYLEDQAVIDARLGVTPGPNVKAEYWGTGLAQDNVIVQQYINLGYEHKTDHDGLRHIFTKPRADVDAQIAQAQAMAKARTDRKRIVQKDKADLGPNSFSEASKEGSHTVGGPTAQSLLED